MELFLKTQSLCCLPWKPCPTSPSSLSKVCACMHVYVSLCVDDTILATTQVQFRARQVPDTSHQNHVPSEKVITPLTHRGGN